MSKLPQSSSIFHILNSKFDNYACSSILFKLAGIYTVVNIVFTLVSCDRSDIHQNKNVLAIIIHERNIPNLIRYPTSAYLS